MWKRPTTSKRLLMAIGADVKLATGKIQTHGEEHLKEIPPDKKVIIATTHISDLDVPIATLKLGKPVYTLFFFWGAKHARWYAHFWTRKFYPDRH